LYTNLVHGFGNSSSLVPVHEQTVLIFSVATMGDYDMYVVNK